MQKLTAQLTALSPVILSVLRIMAALLFIEHGTMKLFGFPASGHPGPPLMSIFGVAGVIETVGGIMVLLGYYTRAAAFIMSGEMAFAYFMVHIHYGFFPALNHGEPAVLFCFIFLYLVFAGGGSLSLDARQGRA